MSGLCAANKRKDFISPVQEEKPLLGTNTSNMTPSQEWKLEFAEEAGVH